MYEVEQSPEHIVIAPWDDPHLQDYDQHGNMATLRAPKPLGIVSQQLALHGRPVSEPEWRVKERGRRR
jgi:hypothetical protein